MSNITFIFLDPSTNKTIAEGNKDRNKEWDFIVDKSK